MATKNHAASRICSLWSIALQVADFPIQAENSAGKEGLQLYISIYAHIYPP